MAKIEIVLSIGPDDDTSLAEYESDVAPRIGEIMILVSDDETQVLWAVIGVNHFLFQGHHHVIVMVHSMGER